MNTQHDQRGFTLLEVLLVIVLVAMMLTLLPKLWGSGVSGAELRSNVRAVASAMRIARDQAVNARREAFVTVNVQSREFTTTVDEKVHKLNNQLVLKLFTAEADQVDQATASFRFYPDGSSNGGRVTIAANEREFAVDVDWLTGRANISEIVKVQ